MTSTTTAAAGIAGQTRQAPRESTIVPTIDDRGVVELPSSRPLSRPAQHPDHHRDRSYHAMTDETTTPTAPVTATRVTMHEAKRHFEAGGAVLVSEYGHEPTQTVTAITTTHDRTRTTWDALAADVKEWRNRYPNQRFYIVPTVDACTCSTDGNLNALRWLESLVTAPIR